MPVLSRGAAVTERWGQGACRLMAGAPTHSVDRASEGSQMPSRGKLDVRTAWDGGRRQPGSQCVSCTASQCVCRLQRSCFAVITCRHRVLINAATLSSVPLTASVLLSCLPVCSTVCTACSPVLIRSACKNESRTFAL